MNEPCLWVIDSSGIDIGYNIHAHTNLEMAERYLSDLKRWFPEREHRLVKYIREPQS